jgi:hypothetical protein
MPLSDVIASLPTSVVPTDISSVNASMPNRYTASLPESALFLRHTTGGGVSDALMTEKVVGNLIAKSFGTSKIDLRADGHSSNFPLRNSRALSRVAVIMRELLTQWPFKEDAAFRVAVEEAREKIEGEVYAQLEDSMFIIHKERSAMPSVQALISENEGLRRDIVELNKREHLARAHMDFLRGQLERRTASLDELRKVPPPPSHSAPIPRLTPPPPQVILRQLFQRAGAAREAGRAGQGADGADRGVAAGKRGAAGAAAAAHGRPRVEGERGGGGS